MSYALRLGLISLAPTAHWVVLVEFFMQGPTYALCYTTIVAYASAVAPPGTSATVQGIVAGMDDGLGEYFTRCNSELLRNINRNGRQIWTCVFVAGAHVHD